MERNRSGSSTNSARNNNENLEDEKKDEKGKKKFPGSSRSVNDQLGPDHRVGELLSSSRTWGVLNYYHWLMVTAVDRDGYITSVIEFDPNEGAGTPASRYGTYFGHPTVPHIVQQTDSRFGEVMAGMRLRFVAY